MADPPKSLTDLPEPAAELLSQALRRIRISGSMQYCFMPQGDWTTDATPAPWRPKDAIGFHIVAAGPCWVDLQGHRTQLQTGDIAAFPFGTPHVLGAGAGGRLIDPGGDLPARPWPATPILRYPDRGSQVRILCGYVQCEATGFAPFRAVLPDFIHIRTADEGAADWLAATVAQIVTEVDQPQPGGGPVLERLTELAFLEILRRQFQTPTPHGWLAAILDPALSRGLVALHADPRRNWTLASLAQESGLSRSALVTRFAELLGTSPMRYLRDWRLFLAAQDLTTTQQPIIAIATDAGYGTEAAFTRAFSRSFGTPPAEWRRSRSASSSSEP
ncbi:AraC family transcriptional regulator [Tabrizicola sp.]|uniref:AraC family transcriptional regulator n=1 Tax=Tabrizicola sp. TaxID=2005166 RepID=UPI003F413E5E